jgi:membrane-associated phospholipid phosphatase
VLDNRWEEEMAETTRSDSDAARTIFYVVAVLTAIYGLALLLFPQAMFTLSEDPGVPANPGWVRWAGGLLSGTAIAAWLAASNPEGQRPLVVGLATAFTLITLALLYSTLVGDYRGVRLLSWLQILGNAALAAAMWWLSSRPIVMTQPPKGGTQSPAKPKT